MSATSIIRVADGEIRDIRHLARWRKKKKEFNAEFKEETQRSQRRGR
jgi:hypothetical protein